LAEAVSHPLEWMPGVSRLYREILAGSYKSSPQLVSNWQQSMAKPQDRKALADLLELQNPTAKSSVEALRQGAGVVVTGQQVGLFGGQLYSPLKAATAVARARQATKAGRPHVAVFWMATEDHDFAEVNHAFFPARRELRRLSYDQAPAEPIPAGTVLLSESIKPLIDELWEVLGPSEATEVLERSYRPGATFAEAFGGFYRQAFAAEGLLVLDPAGGAAHRMGANVLQAAIERADELHAALLERNKELADAGFHAQVAVGDQSSLLFLIDEKSGARLALKRLAPSDREPDGLWVTLGSDGRRSYKSSELLAILAEAPERISPSALLRPLFQDRMLGTSLTIGGPAEIAYYAQSAVLFERILGYVTASGPRFSATILSLKVGNLLKRYELALGDLVGTAEPALTRRLADAAMPEEWRSKLASARQALDAGLEPLLDLLVSGKEGLGRSAETSARKMRYQMARLENFAARVVAQREERIAKDAGTLVRELHPGALQERVLAGASFYARHGFRLSGEMVRLAESALPGGHTEMWMEE